MARRFKAVWAFAVAASLAGCETAVPDSGAGVGFEDYQSYEAARLAQPEGSAAPDGQEPQPEADSQAISSEELSAAGLPTAGSGTPQTSASAPENQSNDGDMSGEIVENGATTTPAVPGISDEQDFQAVASRETIESDRERLERQAESYVVIQPTELPERPDDSAPNIVEFALSTTHPVGREVYGRSAFASSDRSARACATYASSDLAQIDFLARGGPERDPRNLDPDGDGYACGWDPAPFRAAAR